MTNTQVNISTDSLATKKQILLKASSIYFPNRILKTNQTILLICLFWFLFNKDKFLQAYAEHGISGTLIPFLILFVFVNIFYFGLYHIKNRMFNAQFENILNDIKTNKSSATKATIEPMNTFSRVIYFLNGEVRRIAVTQSGEVYSVIFDDSREAKLEGFLIKQTQHIFLFGPALFIKKEDFKELIN